MSRYPLSYDTYVNSGTPRTSPTRHKYKSILWQLQSQTSPSTRERTTSTLSTASTQLSYTFVPDPEISSSFVASLETTQMSNAEEPVTSSPAHSSHTSSAEEQAGYRRQVIPAVPELVSSVIQPHALPPFPPLEPLHPPPEKLLTRGPDYHLGVPYGGPRTSATFPIRTDPPAIRP
ncbi:hypothetical protein EDC04DRAFT_1090464 [Pisolithus marmoratus]|nr:hypothetical protein EDC04DRAFT_1090464 [Pisolithus marmoratus]